MDLTGHCKAANWVVKSVDLCSGEIYVSENLEDLLNLEVVLKFSCWVVLSMMDSVDVEIMDCELVEDIQRKRGRGQMAGEGDADGEGCICI